MLCRLTLLLLCLAVVGCVDFSFETCNAEEVQITAMTKRTTSEIACGCIGYVFFRFVCVLCQRCGFETCED